MQNRVHVATDRDIICFTTHWKSGLISPRSASGDNMIRSELVAIIKDEHPDLSIAEANRAADAIFNSIVDTLANGGRVELRGFGAFSVKSRDARRGRNPRTGESVDVESKHAIGFKPGKGILHRMNPHLMKD